MSTQIKNCPCCSAKLYSQCCEPLHLQKTLVNTAEQLMRSRYSAYVLGDMEYIKATWHPDTIPTDLQVDSNTAWAGLQIIETEAGQAFDAQGMVHFKAYFKHQGKLEALQERSRFLKRDGAWCYVDGEILDSRIKISRNDPCICGSGKKYKRCCG